MPPLKWFNNLHKKYEHTCKGVFPEEAKRLMPDDRWWELLWCKWGKII